MSLAVEAPAKYNIDIKRDMQKVQQVKGIGVFKQIKDFLHLRKLKTGLNMEEYIGLQVYDQDRSEFNKYVGDMRSRSIFLLANKLTSWGAASDKFFYQTLMEAAKLPTPKIHGMVHKSRHAADAEPLRSEDDIKAFLKKCKLPIFGKPVDALHGDGAINILSRKGDVLETNFGEKLKIDEVAKQVSKHLEEKGYIFQDTLIAHPEIAKITNNRISTARVLVCIGPDGPFVHDSLLRMPAGNNLVDNFKRAGNLLASINKETGELSEAIRGVGINQERMDNHPDTNEAIAGKIVPDFQAAKELSMEASSVYPDLHIQSWDVAFTPEGPVLLELNPGGNFNIYQFIHRRGLLDDKFFNFIKWCKENDVSSPPKDKSYKEALTFLNL